ncbi:MAG: glycosyltransferase [Actinomycetota bacterium]|nr:glycosyltransferase [Actinomycetota bacterium]
MPRASLVSGTFLRRTATFVAVASVARTAYALTSLLKLRSLAAEPLSEQPTVTVIIPARNEEATIDRCLSGLRAQRHQALRILVVDDHSTDATAAVADKHVAQDPRVRVVRSDGPPEGWAGKVHAMHVGVRAAEDIDDWPGSTGWLLFFDADTVARPDLVGRLLATAEEQAADLVSTAGATDGTRASYWLLMPPATNMHHEIASPSGRGVLALAIGHCILLRRSAYNRVGGWSALADSRCDDVGMATLVRDSGGQTLMVDSQRELFSTGIDEFADGWRSLRKSFVGATGGDLRILVSVAIGHLVYGLTPPLMVTIGLRRPDTRLLLAGAVGWAAQAVAHAKTAQRLGQPAASGALAPFSWAAIGCGLGDAARTVISGSSSWRGRPMVTRRNHRGVDGRRGRPPGEGSMDPSEAARHYYQAELAAGIDRFFEPRRQDCPWCGSTDLSVRLRTSDLIQRKPGQFTLEQCGACRHIFQNPRLTPAGLDFYYRDFYDGLGQALMERTAAMSEPSYCGRAEMVRPFTMPTAWLDVGAGHGHFCRHAREAWPNTAFDGLDQSAAIEQAQSRGWIDHGYRGQFIPLADQLAGRYDVVSMHHYLEHTREPLDELDTAAKILPAGGYMLLELPNPDSRFGRLLGRWWMPWFPPQHQHMIPERNLVAALADRGFSTVAVERGAAHQGFDLTLSLWLLINSCAPDPRLPWMAAAPTRWRRLRRTTVWAVGQPLLVGAYVLDELLCRVVGRTRGGNAYRVLARKDG